jgi:hypothetical protein
MGKNPIGKKIKTLKAIRSKCLECCCDSANEVNLCTVPNCGLFQFRFGKNPNRAGMGPKVPFFIKKTVREPAL